MLAIPQAPDRELTLDMGSVMRSQLILRQLAGGGIGEKIYTRIYKYINAGRAETTEHHCGINIQTVTSDVVKHVCQRILALAYTKFTESFDSEQVEFIKTYGVAWTDNAYTALRTDKNMLACTLISAQKYEDIHISRFCDDAVKQLEEASSRFDDDLFDQSRLVQMFTEFVRAMPAVTNDQFTTLCGEWMGEKTTTSMRAEVEFALLRRVIVQTGHFCVCICCVCVV